MLELFTYEGQQVRTVFIDGEPWFVLADVCAVLEIRNARDAAARVPDEMKGVGSIDTLGGRQTMTVVTEAGLYEVAFRSDKPEAAAFRRWVTGTVLPQIRKTGSYGVQPAIPSSFAEALELAASQARELEAVKPKADAWDDLASGEGDYSVGDAAKMLQRAGIVTGRDRLFEEMWGMNWLYRQSGRWQARQTAVDAGRLRHKPQSHRHPETGATVLDAPQVRVTMKGIEQLRVHLLTPIKELAEVGA